MTMNFLVVTQARTDHFASINRRLANSTKKSYLLNPLILSQR